jgi:hypothetical protein
VFSVLCPIHFAHAARAERGLDLVRAEASPSSERRGSQPILADDCLTWVALDRDDMARTAADYTEVTVYSPIVGSAVPYYNIAANKLSD